MELKRFDDINEFLDIAKPVLIENEVENNLILGVALHIQKDPSRYKEQFLAIIYDEEEISAISVCTPPFKLLFWGKNSNCNDEINILVNNIAKDNLNITGVLAENQHAFKIAETWRNIIGKTFRPGMSERIYVLTEVDFPKSAKGRMRLAQLEDLELICKWMKEFHIEATPDDPLSDFTKFAKLKIENKDLAIWQNNGRSVALASRARPTFNGICINLVYTPQQFRRNGYATALVAHLSQKLLNDGWKFIALFTDLSNPTSNSIYQKVGFKSVCDFQEYYFE